MDIINIKELVRLKSTNAVARVMQLTLSHGMCRKMETWNRGVVSH